MSMNTGINILIIGGGMYVSGRGTDSDGTIIPALLEARRHVMINRLGLVTTSADSANENRERINTLAKRMGVDSQCEYFPKSGKNELSYLEAAEQFKPDAVIVAVPDHLHASVCIPLIEKGIHCLVVKPMANTLAQVYKNVVRCKICGNLKNINLNCTCSNKNYDQICVVENIADMWVIESTGIYKGHYHILGGTLPALENKKDDVLLVSALIDRVKKNPVKEVILATSATIEGQTTAHYIQDSLKDIKVKVSKLAQGVPVGGEIEFLDDGTLFSAFKNRGPVVSD